MDTGIRGLKELTDTLLFTGVYFWTGYAFGSAIDSIHIPDLPGEKEDETAQVYSESRLLLNVLVQVTLISFVYIYGVQALGTLRNPLWCVLRTRDAPRYNPRFFHPLQDGLFFSLGLVWSARNMQRQIHALTRSL